MTIEDIQNYMYCWGQHTYREETDRFYTLRNNVEMQRRIILYLEKLNIDGRYMDGNSITNLPRINAAEENNGVVPQYTEVFNQWLDMNYISPLTYIYQICKNIPDNISEELACGIIARGLRSFPSFFRELELAKQIEARIPGCIIHPRNVDMDVSEHTDILLEYNGSSYRIWSYQSTNKGLNKTSKRFSGEKGKIPEGMHIMCPFSLENPENRQNNGWFFYSDRQCCMVVDMIINDNMQIDLYENIDMRQKELEKYLAYFKKIYKR